MINASKILVAILLLASPYQAKSVEAKSFDSGTVLASYERVIEWTFESKKHYTDPFNEVEVDIVFRRGKNLWRVPCFWRGGSRWTVRFAPPEPGVYSYRVESTDKLNPDLNGKVGRLAVEPYRGNNPLLKRGSLRVSKNGRYFEHTDGTPFFWLADTWWAGLSDRLPWEGVKLIAADRRTKGFSVILLTGGLVPSNEEMAPSDPGFCNEGGCVWEPNFKQINPAFFDYADRRINLLIENDLVPAIVGGWRQILGQMGPSKLKKHWRYLIARYGSYPVFWIVGGEVYDPPAALATKYAGFAAKGSNFTPVGADDPSMSFDLRVPGWTDIVRYVREIDPYHHPLTVHEIDQPFENSLQDPSLTDFHLPQGGDIRLPRHTDQNVLLKTIASQIRDRRQASTPRARPVVFGETLYEQTFQAFLANFQRAAFWYTILNGGAGFSYGAAGIFASYSAEKPFHRFFKYSFLDWRESMGLSGSYEIGLGSQLLKRYRWWEFEPHPEWLTMEAGQDDHRLPPFAAGIPENVRFVYMPYFGDNWTRSVPRINGLEVGVVYHAFYWEPTLGIEVDLGTIQAEDEASETPATVKPLRRELFDAKGQYRGELRGSGWEEYARKPQVTGDSYQPERPPTAGDWLLVLEAVAVN